VKPTDGDLAMMESPTVPPRFIGRDIWINGHQARGPPVAEAQVRSVSEQRDACSACKERVEDG
jgi:hypothetical protein